MSEQIEKLLVETTLCGWCGIPLDTANVVRESVCVRCYELLIKANLTNEEIFAGRNSRKEPPYSNPDQADQSKK